MLHGIANVPTPVNEPIRQYAPGSSERASLQTRLRELLAEEIEIPLIIGGKEVRTGKVDTAVCPHDHRHVLARFHQAGPREVARAAAAAKEAWREWSEWPWEARAAIFLKAADLLAGPWRDTVNGATMLNQSKTVYQAEIDSACEIIDFWRFNPFFMKQIYEQQPISVRGLWDLAEFRALEGFVFALTPFNFTAIGANLPTAPALMGNTILWKPASTAVFSNYKVMKLLQEAGLPDGVVNFLPGRGAEVGDPILAHPEFAGIHFTGSTQTFDGMWKMIAENRTKYRGYPRVVGGTGGKDFVFAHHRRTPARSPLRWCGAPSSAKGRSARRPRGPRADVLWPTVRKHMKEMLAEIKMGPVPTSAISWARSSTANRSTRSWATSSSPSARASPRSPGAATAIVAGLFHRAHGGGHRESEFKLMQEEIFGPVLTIHPYKDKDYDATLTACDATSPYALTGAIFSQDRGAILEMTKRLRHAAGNFYINDKPTGAVVGQQPFGGSRASGTNDKAGSAGNLMRWVTQRSIKETFVPPVDFRYPHMDPEG